MGFNPTPAQKEALEAFGNNVIVSAGAGSGKTAVLSEKVKYLVEKKGISVDNMLILTFTNAAAQEMKNRIQKKLKENSFEESIKVLSADICTFDAFALSLVKKYHLLLGLDDNISVVDSPLVYEKRNKWIDELFDELYEKEDPMFIETINRLTTKNDDVLKELLNNIILKSSLSLSIDDYFKPLNSEEKERRFNEFVTYVTNYLNSLNEEMYNVILLIPTEEYRNKIYASVSELLAARDIDMYVNASYLNGNSYRWKKSYTEEDLNIKNQFEIIKNKIIDIRLSLKNLNDLKKDYYEAFKYKEYLYTLAEIIYKKEQKFKYEHQTFEFSDISYLAYKLVKENDDIKNELKNKYKIIMIDEYQDTSFSQERFINLIENKNLFMVGDIKQSIYGFRNARPDIFKGKYEKYAKKDDGIKIDLNSNFRSRKEVLKDINTIFKDIMSDEIGDANYKKDHIIISGNKDYDSLDIDKPNTQALVYKESDTLSKEEIEANIVADDILDKMSHMYVMDYAKEGPCKKKVDFSSFCILIGKGTHFPIFKRVFEEKGIPLFIRDNEKIANNHLIRIMENILLIMNKINNNTYDDEFIHLFVSIARSFIFEYSDEKIYDIIKNKTYYNDEIVILIKEILESSDSLSISYLIGVFFEKVDIYTKLFKLGFFENNKKYLDFFMNYFIKMDELNYSFVDASNFIKNIQNYDIGLEMESQSTDENSVKLMNIHKSKGLEFPIVYFCGLSNEFNNSDLRKRHFVSNRYGLIFASENGDKTIDSLVDKILLKKENMSEEVRKFYVALTRAKEQMIFVYPEIEEKKEKELAKSKSFLDFIKYSSININETDVEIRNLKNNKANEIEEKELVYEPITFSEVKQEKKKRSSKILSFNSNRDYLEFGTNIHFIFQVANFENEDISMFDDNEQKLLKKFYKTDLFKEIKKGKIYKEYEFITSNNVGIIDMFSILDDKIILVDYKLKNIDDEAYVEQLKVYESYLKEKFNKPVEVYLYSILLGEFNRII